MNLITVTAAALALTLSSSGLAVPASTHSSLPTDPFIASSSHVMLGGYLSALEAQLDTDQSKLPGLVSGLHSAWKGAKLPVSLKADLAASAEHLLRRTQEARIEQVDLDLLRLEAVDARLFAGIASFEALASNGKWSPEKFHAAVMDWLGSTTIFADAPDPEARRVEVSSALELALLKADGTSDMSRSLSVEMLRMRLAIAIRRFEIALERGDLTPVEFDRMQRMAIIRVRRIIDENF
ncbi:MAG: hypothetical protein AAGG01_08320 [Planctomycetota bacterium]